MDEIRRRHGNNIFQVAYRGDAEALRGVLEGRCEVLEQPEPEFGAAYSSLKLHVERDADVREVIARINDAVELRSDERHLHTGRRGNPQRGVIGRKRTSKSRKPWQIRR